MRRAAIIIITFLTIWGNVQQALAAIDPARAAAIDVASNLEKKALKAQTEMQALQATGHIWIKEEVKAMTDFQKEFNDYLSSFDNLLGYAAEIYGIYYDLNSIVRSVKSLNREIGNHPENALAVAFSTRKNNIYMKIVQTGTNVALDIREIVLNPEGKSTEAQRLEILQTIRPKLRQLEREIRMLTNYVRYTSMAELLREITGRSYIPASKREVALRCKRNWTASAKTAMNTKRK